MSLSIFEPMTILHKENLPETLSNVLDFFHGYYVISLWILYTYSRIVETYLKIILCLIKYEKILIFDNIHHISDNQNTSLQIHMWSNKPRLALIIELFKKRFLITPSSSRKPASHRFAYITIILMTSHSERAISHDDTETAIDSHSRNPWTYLVPHMHMCTFAAFSHRRLYDMCNVSSMFNNTKDYISGG